MKLYFNYDISRYVLCAYLVICLRNVINVWTKNKHRVYSLRYWMIIVKHDTWKIIIALKDLSL